MGPGQRPTFHFENSGRAKTGPENKKEVKTASFSPPGVGGVLHDNTLCGSAGLPCQAGLQPHSRLFLQFVRRLTTKELVFLRFVALQNAGVNGKKSNRSIGSSLLAGLECRVAWPMPPERRFSFFPLACSFGRGFPHHLAERRGAVWLLQVVGVGRGRGSIFRILRIPAGKENG